MPTLAFGPACYRALLLAASLGTACFGQSSALLLNATGATLLVYPQVGQDCAETLLLTPCNGLDEREDGETVTMNLATSRLHLVVLPAQRALRISHPAPVRAEVAVLFKVVSLPGVEGPELKGFVSFTSEQAAGNPSIGLVEPFWLAAELPTIYFIPKAPAVMELLGP